MLRPDDRNPLRPGRLNQRSSRLNGAAHVFILGRRQASLDSVASTVPGKNIHPVVADVTSKDSLAAAVKTITDQHGVSAIDVLVANSGISGPSVPLYDEKQQPLPVEKVIENMWKPETDEVTGTFGVNVTGIHFTVAVSCK